MKKILYCITFTLLAMFTYKTYAYDFTVNGIYYDISSMSDLTATVTSCNDDLYNGKIIIPDSVEYKNIYFKITSLSLTAFKGCTALNEIIIGGNIKSIPTNAFNGCTSLSTISIPKNIFNIYDGAFTGCISLRTVIIEDSSKKLSLGCKSYKNAYGYGLFYDCPLDSVYIGRDIIFNASASYGYSPFYSTSVSKLSIGDSVSKINPLSFWRCNNIQKLRIPQNIKEIGNSAFAECVNLKELEFLAIECSDFSITNIQNQYPFRGTNINNVIINEGVKKMPGFFMYNQSSIKNINIPSSLSEIGCCAFTYCDSLTDITVSNENNKFLSDNGVLYNKNKSKLVQYPKAKAGEYIILNNVDSIGDYAFFGCNLLTAITFPNTISYIGKYAFCSCNSLKSIYIPKFVKYIGNSSFANCNNLNKVIYNAQKCKDFEQDFDTKKYPFDGSPISEIIFDTDAEYVPANFMNNQINLKEIDFNNVQWIGWRAFVGCSSLKIIIFGKETSAIAISAFLDCDSIIIIYVYNEIPPKGNLFSEGAFTTMYFEDPVYISATLFVPVNCISTYRSQDGWRNFFEIEEYTPSALEYYMDKDVIISVINQSIIVNGIDDNCKISLFDANGILLYEGFSHEILTTGSGLYFIKINNTVHKVMVS